MTFDVTTTRNPTSSLTANKIHSGYGASDTLFGVSLHIDPGEVVSVFGPNGAGKTTLLRTLFGVLPLRRGEIIFRDRVWCPRQEGWGLSHRRYMEALKAGMGYIPAEHYTFPSLTVEENLVVASRLGKGASFRRDACFEQFPILYEKRGVLAQTLSGGQQRILSLAMAMTHRPTLLLMDEPSLGVAPNIVSDVFAFVRGLVDEGEMSILLVEQNISEALRISDRVYYLRSGEIIGEESKVDAMQRESFWDLF